MYNDMFIIVFDPVYNSALLVSFKSRRLNCVARIQQQIWVQLTVMETLPLNTASKVKSLRRIKTIVSRSVFPFSKFWLVDLSVKIKGTKSFR